MTLPYWVWQVSFQTASSPGESTVVAPHPAAAKQSVAAAIDGIETFDSVLAGKRFSTTHAEQRFDGYAPRLHTVSASVESARATVRGD